MPTKCEGLSARLGLYIGPYLSNLATSWLIARSLITLTLYDFENNEHVCINLHFHTNSTLTLPKS